MSVPILGDGDKQQEEEKRIQRIAKGEVPGMKSARYTVTDKGDIEGLVGKMKGKASNPDDGFPYISGIIYALASKRDAKYSAAGRIYMRKLALNTRMRLAYMRALAFAYMDESTK